MQRTVKAVGFTIEWVLTAVSDCGTMSVVGIAAVLTARPTIFIWTTIEWVLTAVSDYGRLLAEKLLLPISEAVIGSKEPRV